VTSSTAITKTELFSKCVLVRASDGEPAKLIATSFDGDSVVQVRAEDGSAEIGFPIEDAFDFDAALFGELCEAHRLGREKRVIKLWERATPLPSAI
jgi:hypothetical protein